MRFEPEWQSKISQSFEDFRRQVRTASKTGREMAAPYVNVVILGVSMKQSGLRRQPSQQGF